MNRTPLRVLAGVSVALACAAGACSPYTVTGRVVRGDSSYMMLVDEGDPRLDEPGIPGVQLKLTVDPGKVQRKVVAQEMSGTGGEVSLPVDELGAGLLDFSVGVMARKAGFSPAEGFFQLPKGGSKRLLIVLSPGRDVPESEWETQTTEDLLREMERFSN